MGWQSAPVVTALEGGGFVIAWESPDGGWEGIFARQYDAAGNAVGDEFLVNTYEVEGQHQPAIASLSGGGFIITWASSGQDGDGYGIYGQRYNGSGSAVGTEFRANSTITSWQYQPAVAGLTAGGFVIVWTSDFQDGGSYGVYAQVYDTDGNTVGGEFLVNTHTAGGQYHPDVTGLSDGGFVVTWPSEPQDGSGEGIYAQVFDAAGNAVGGSSWSTRPLQTCRFLRVSPPCRMADSSSPGSRMVRTATITASTPSVSVRMALPSCRNCPATVARTSFPGAAARVSVSSVWRVTIL
jgi:hypothetical protein